MPTSTLRFSPRFLSYSSSKLRAAQRYTTGPIILPARSMSTSPKTERIQNPAL
ncbi:hypothetical protein ACJ72_07931, partial [Emergomyces africanus]